MLDVAVLLFALRALHRALRARWHLGLVLAVVFVALWLGIAALGWHEHAAERFGVSGMWMLVLFGVATASTHADVPRALAAGCAFAGFVLANRRVAAIPPLRADYPQASNAALAFLAPLILSGGEVALLLFARLVID